MKQLDDDWLGMYLDHWVVDELEWVSESFWSFQLWELGKTRISSEGELNLVVLKIRDLRLSSDPSEESWLVAPRRACHSQRQWFDISRWLFELVHLGPSAIQVLQRLTWPIPWMFWAFWVLINTNTTSFVRSLSLSRFRHIKFQRIDTTWPHRLRHR